MEQVGTLKNIKISTTIINLLSKWKKYHFFEYSYLQAQEKIKMLLVLAFLPY